MSTEGARLNNHWNTDSPWRRIPWTLPCALLIWTIALWGLGSFIKQPDRRPVTAPIDARLIESARAACEAGPARKSRGSAAIETCGQERTEADSFAPAKAPAHRTASHGSRSSAALPARSASPFAKCRNQTAPCPGGTCRRSCKERFPIARQGTKPGRISQREG